VSYNRAHPMSVATGTRIGPNEVDCGPLLEVATRRPLHLASWWIDKHLGDLLTVATYET
jgi:hypothetical protein